MSHKGINLYKMLIMNSYTLAKRDKSSDAQSDEREGPVNFFIFGVFTGSLVRCPYSSLSATGVTGKLFGEILWILSSFA